MRFLLPCETCQNNFARHLAVFPVPGNKEELGEWLVDLHNRVNLNLGKSLANREEMVAFWKEKEKTVETIEDTGLMEAMEYMVMAHPGYYQITLEEIQAHLYFWETVPGLLSDKWKGVGVLRRFVQDEMLTIDTVAHKQDYKEWFADLQKALKIQRKKKLD